MIEYLMKCFKSTAALFHGYGNTTDVLNNSQTIITLKLKHESPAIQAKHRMLAIM